MSSSVPSRGHRHHSAGFAEALLHWYPKIYRRLPWRDTTDPYAIWVSEIMLQQTQVATVLPYYRRFLSTYPTVSSLAAAPLDHVLKLWQGLGYYARARYLHRAAQKVVDTFGATIPSSRAELQSLPGIGRSTAGAILNIAFGQRHPILDGNVKRVLSRYFCVRGPIKEKRVEDRLWQLSAQVLPQKRVAIFTQAIMELGATVCLPKRPQCSLCPVASGCQGYKKGVQDKLPLKPPSKKPPHLDYVAAIIRQEGKAGNRVWIRKRPEKGLLAGLWEFPGGTVENKDSFHEVIQKEVGRTISGVPWFIIKHPFSHFRMTLHVVSCKTSRPCPASHKSVPISQLGEYAFSSAHQKIVLRLQKETLGF